MFHGCHFGSYVNIYVLHSIGQKVVYVYSQKPVVFSWMGTLPQRQIQSFEKLQGPPTHSNAFIVGRHSGGSDYDTITRILKKLKTE